MARGGSTQGAPAYVGAPVLLHRYNDALTRLSGGGHHVCRHAVSRVGAATMAAHSSQVRIVQALLGCAIVISWCCLPPSTGQCALLHLPIHF